MTSKRSPATPAHRSFQASARTIVSSWTGALVLVLPCAAPAWSAAEPTAAAIETIVVTGRKRTERLIDVPVAAVAFEANRLQEEYIVDLQDLLRRTPGVSTAYLGTTFSNEVIMRGQGSGRMTNSEVATGLYRNGAFVTGGNIGGRNFNRMDLFDAERIEVFRGPQGAVFGRNAVGGAINVISARPEASPSGRVTLRHGSNDRYEVEAIANTPVTEALAVRLGGIYADQRDGHFDNAFDGRVLDDQRFRGLRATLRYVPDPSLEVNLTVDHVDERGPSFAVGNYNPTTDQDPYIANDNRRSRFQQDETTAILEVGRDLRASRLTGVTLYKTRDASTVDDLDGFLNLAIPAFANLERYSDDAFTRFGQTVHLVSEGSGPWQWLVGLEYLYLSVDFTEEISGFPAFAVFNNSQSFTRSRDQSYAAFGSIGYDLTTTLNVAGELRFTHDDKSMDLRALNFEIDGSPRPATEKLQRNFNNTSPSLIVTWIPREHLTVFGRAATAYRAGGFNNVPDPQTPARFRLPYDEETTVSWELGAKSLWLDGRLMIAGAAFLSRTDDILIGDRAATGPAFILFATNGGRGEQRGLELDASWAIPLDGAGGELSMVLGGSWMDAEFTSGALKGNMIPYSRDWELSLSTTWRRPLAPGASMYLNHTFLGAWGGWQDEPSNRPLDDIRVHDFSIGLTIGRWALQGVLKNAFDQFYNPQRTSPIAIRASIPRTWLLSASLNF